MNTASDTLPLFTESTTQRLGAEAVLLRGFALGIDQALIDAISTLTVAAPLRHLRTPRGQALSAAMSNCGKVGWYSDAQGYRYCAIDPQSQRPWPAMPVLLQQLAQRAAARAGFDHFAPDACLINRYAIGSSMGLHVDRDERDFSAPIVSVSLGLPAKFLFGGARRSDAVQRIPVQHGDVLVWGGTTRLHYHGVARIAAGSHPLAGPYRYNLTFRRAL